MIFLLSIPTILAALAARWFHRRWSNPATIFLGILGIQLALYGALTGPDGYTEPSSRTLLASGGSLLGFALGYVLVIALVYPIAGRWMGVRQRFQPLPQAQAKHLLRLAILASLVAMIWHAVVGLNNLSQGDLGIALLDLRTVYLTNLESFSQAPHVAILAQFLLVFLYLHGAWPRTSMTCFIIVSVGCAIWKVERSAVMMAGYSGLIAYEMRSGNPLNIKTMLITVAIAITIFIATAMLRDSWDSVGEVFGLMADYFAKNIQNFNAFVVDLPVNGSLELVLGKYATVFNAPLADIVVDQDEYFNTYSYLRPVYLYGGLWFCSVFGGIVGMTSAALYLWSLRRPIVAVFYCFASFALFLSFFDYAFSWTNWAYYAIVGMGLSVMIKRRRRSRQSVSRQAVV
jgi:oligosaccharide repeat unit polymerase